MDFTLGPKRNDLLENSEFVSGIITGALIGLAIGILIAPHSGEDLRNKIAGAVGKKTDDLADKWDDTKSEVNSELDTVKANVSVSVEKAADQLDKYGDKIADQADKLTHEAEDKAGDLADGTKSTIDRVKDAFRIG